MKVILILFSFLLVSPVFAKEHKRHHDSSKTQTHPDYRPPYKGEKLLMDKTSGEKVYGDYGSYYWPYKYTSPTYEKKGEKK